MTNKDKKEGKDIVEDKEQARLKLINMLYDTPDERMSELTVIPRRQVLALSMMSALGKALDPERKTPLDELWLKEYYKLMRSVGGQHLIRATALAESQMGAEEEEEGETYEL